MTPLTSSTTNIVLAEKQRNSRPSPFVTINLYSGRDLLEQPVLPELREVINASYRDHITKNKNVDRLQADTQIVDEIGDSGFTAVAMTLTEIVGTASVKPWVPNSEGIIWKPSGYYEGKSAEEAILMHSSSLSSHTSSAGADSCKGDFEIFLVAVKPGVEYRKRGIAESLVKVCEDELKRRFEACAGQNLEKSSLRIMLKVVSEINGSYWLKKGFRVVGECWCPPFTWDLEKAFILWAMRRDMSIY
ncbi:acyl-CoA N-acyltransferase [Aspergillus terreus]|uniref:Acyl-CoA N-acyltransferase n=1 Tax=Aspergillus terreus TaxID=33178 RepID=A0A5M3YS07_ASPTE|nr:hypothetical protein ATETN484_0002064200 [Aspergillus terreus]GFF15498.1 acyl-CoA N-acyltransferase [Aspergillus terreus]